MGLLRFFCVYFSIIVFTSAEYSFTLYQGEVALEGTTDLSLLNPTLPTYFIIHGWMQTGTQPWLIQMKDVYLSLEPANVVVFNWAPYSQDIKYFGSVLAVRFAGKILGQKIATLFSTLKINIATTQVVGFSLGGHVAGVAGQVFKSIANTSLEIIVGLDSPLLGFVSDQGRLSRNDAKFVLVFHTSGFGRRESYGHVDVYFNFNGFLWGITQPNCPADPGVDVPSNFKSGWCHHVRSIAYWVESITDNRFLAVDCSCWVKEVRVCGNKSTLIGHNISVTSVGTFCLKTNGVGPFGQGLVA